VAAIGAAYARADTSFRLPMHGGFATLPHVVDVPFIARRSSRDPADTRRTLGLPAGERLVLVSFGGYGLDGLDLDALSRLDGYLALVSGSVPLGNVPTGQAERRGSVMRFDEARMYSAGVRYEDLVRAVDVVVSKPGYGIIAECLANGTALLYTSRGHFVEYDVLVREMPRVLRTAFINHADLFAGRWAPHLDGLLAQPAPPERPPVDGAELIAAQLANAFG
jgi:L-arabinokinase